MKKILIGIIAIAFVIVAVYGARQIIRGRKLNRLEKRATEKFDAGNYRLAIKDYETMLGKLPGKETPRQQRIEHKLAVSYKKLAEAPGVPAFRTVEYYQKAAAYDKSVVDKQQIDKVITSELTPDAPDNYDPGI